MPLITSFSPEILRRRHGLSAQQINSLFGKKVCEEGLEDKIRSLDTLAEFLRITDALVSEGIGFVPLKGPVLSYRIYGDATIRKYRDLDIMVDLASVPKAKDLLITLGYEPVGYQLPDGKPGQQIVFNHLHHLLFAHKSLNLRVELHWRLFQSPPVRFRKLDELVNNNLSEITFEGRSIRVLSCELELLYLIMHGGIHYWRRLKWLTDIKEFMESYKIDWVKFRAMADDLRASRLISLANYVLAEYYASGPSVPWVNEDIPFMRFYAIRQISKVEAPDRETLAMKLSRLRFSFHCYPDLMYKVRRVRSAVIFYAYYAFRKGDRVAA